MSKAYTEFCAAHKFSLSAVNNLLGENVNQRTIIQNHVQTNLHLHDTVKTLNVKLAAQQKTVEQTQKLVDTLKVTFMQTNYIML